MALPGFRQRRFYGHRYFGDGAYLSAPAPIILRDRFTQELFRVIVDENLDVDITPVTGPLLPNEIPQDSITALDFNDNNIGYSIIVENNQILNAGVTPIRTRPPRASSNGSVFVMGGIPQGLQWVADDPFTQFSVDAGAPLVLKTSSLTQPFNVQMVGGYVTITGGVNLAPGRYLITSFLSTSRITLASSPAIDNSFDSGPGSGNIQYFTRPTIQNSTPSSPVLTVGAVTFDTVPLSWTASLGGLYAIDHYIIERRIPGEQFAEIGTTTGQTFDDTSVAESTDYEYRVIAVDSRGYSVATSNIELVSVPASGPFPLTIGPTSMLAAANTFTVCDAFFAHDYLFISIAAAVGVTSITEFTGKNVDVYSQDADPWTSTLPVNPNSPAFPRFVILDNGNNCIAFGFYIVEIDRDPGPFGSQKGTLIIGDI